MRLDPHHQDLMRGERCKMPKATMNLLVVEDDAALRTSLSHIFASFGHRVRCAADGFSAIPSQTQSKP